MMRQHQIDRANAWLDSITKAAPQRISIAAGLRSALASGQPGGWASDHRAEANHYTGWNYVAIRAIALQGMQASVTVYDSSRPVAKSKLKSDYNEQADKGQPVDDDNALLMLLKKPNSLRYIVDGGEIVRKKSGAMFRFQQLLQLNLTGKCLVWNVPNRAGKTVERYVIPTAVAEPQAPCPEFPNGWWRVRPELARSFAEQGWFSGISANILGAPIPAERMQVIAWPHPIFSDDGQSPLAASALWTDTADGVDKARWAGLENGVDPTIAVSMAEDWNGTQEELDAASTKFNQKYAGKDNRRKAMFVTGGAEVTKLSATPDEMEFQDAFVQLRDAIMAIHGTPGTAAGITQANGREGLYAPLLQWTILTVQPQLSFLAEEDTAWFAPEFGPTFTIEYLAKSVNDPSERENELKTDLAGKIRTRDEVRLLRGLPAIGGEKGDEFVGGTGVAGQVIGGQDVVPQATSDLRQPAKPTQPPSATPAVSADAGIETELTLNGAQIDAARNVLLDIQLGHLAEPAAIELLVGVGIPRDRARAMVSAQSAIPAPEIPGSENGDIRPEPKSNGHHSNGHAKRFAFRDYP